MRFALTGDVIAGRRRLLPLRSAISLPPLMHYLSTISRSSSVRCFVLLFAIGFAWALYTQHAWEDYYITFRASKNLAIGEGLTFTAGERVHSFTSPLGVLLPALASLLTANSSDEAALWIFRIMSIAAYAGAGVFLWRLARALYSARAGAILLIALFATDTKIVDFSTNGMETGFLLFFLAGTLYALLIPTPRQALQLGLSWAGLMWSRPDSFIYIAVLVAAAALFRGQAGNLSSRIHFLRTVAIAASITTVVYAPWLVWAWAYYGSPVPHTVVAKGLFGEPVTLVSLWQSALQFPAKLTVYRDILTTTFMPAYSFRSGWPEIAFHLSYWISVATMFLWLLPRVRLEARIASIAFLGGQFYLTTFVRFPVPWYIPTLTVFALIAITSTADQLMVAARSGLVARVASIVLFAGALTIFGMSAYQLRWQQMLIEDGQRTVIGKWLRQQAATPNDTVFLEPLGYIGYYSNLKMLDYPGLSSPEVVAARKRAPTHAYPDCWPVLIYDLEPDWIVLRSHESHVIRVNAPDLLTRFYTLARVFDVRSKVDELSFLPGRGYLTNDAYFEVYRRTANWPDSDGPAVKFTRVTTGLFRENDANGTPMQDVGVNLSAHAPSKLSFKKPIGARWLIGSYWIAEGAYDNPNGSSDGVDFKVEWKSQNGPTKILLSRALDPKTTVSDRGPQQLSLELPSDEEGELTLSTGAGRFGSNAFDWAFWSSLVLASPVANTTD